MGVQSRDDAIKVASYDGLDLVEVAPNADPPVCRIMDYGKYKYEQEQKAKRAKKHQSTIVVKEMKMRPKIDRHDFETKENHIRRFLKKKAKVKVTIMFRGRELTHPDIGRKLLTNLAEEVSDLGEIESPPKLDGRNMIMVLAPVAESSRPAPKKVEAKPEDKEEKQATKTEKKKSEDKEEKRAEDKEEKKEKLEPADEEKSE